MGREGRYVEIIDGDGRVVDHGYIEMDNLDGTVIVNTERMGLINVPKSFIRK